MRTDTFRSSSRRASPPQCYSVRRRFTSAHRRASPPSDESSAVPTAPSPAVTALAVKEARWETQRRASKLNIAPVRVGLTTWAVNLLLRRPADFPTFQYARFRREIARQAARSPLDGADIAVVKFRERLLSSTIDARFSKPVVSADIDQVARDVIATAEARDGVTFTDEDRDAVTDAAWKQYADFFGSPAVGRSLQVERAAEFLPHGGPGVARRLRELEAEAVAALRARPPRR